MGTRSSSPSYIRAAHHAGSWYSSSAQELDQQLSNFLAKAASESTASSFTNKRLRAIICPHAGYSYSGATAAFAYHALAQELADSASPIETIVILHPSHHEYLDNQCAISGATTIQTPLGDLQVNQGLRREVLALSSRFTNMTQRVDEHEHSGEMQYPYLAKLIQTAHKEHIQVLPVMCGQLSLTQQDAFGKLLAGILSRPSILTVVSTDFCHWGSRFQFTPTPTPSTASIGTSSMPIHAFIEQMDRKGMTLIEMQQPGAFADYLKQTRNTICGRNAVAVWMQAMAAAKSESKNNDELTVRFVKYAQSSAVQSMHESSVSYAAAVAYATNGHL
jgi:AmmeMemoRadiSam system protein B